MRRALAALAVFYLIATIGFIATEASPTVPGILPRVGIPHYDPCGMRATWALDQPVGIRYLVYLANIYRGEWGASLYNSCKPVTSVILEHAADTLILAFGALLVSGVLARLAGPALARRHRRIGDSLGSAASLGAAALPAAGIGLVFVLLLMATGPGFVPVGDHSPGYTSMPLVLQLADYLAHLLVPFLTVLVSSLGYLVLAMRNASLYEQIRRGPRLILDSLAGGPGAPGEKRSAVPRLLPELAVYMGWTVSASLLVEIAFGLNGLGTLLVSAAMGDTLTVNGIFLFLSLLLVIGLAGAGLLDTGTRAGWFPAEPPLAPSAPVLRRLLRAFITRKATLVGLALLAVLVGMTLVAPSLVGAYNRFAVPVRPFEPPSPGHLFGTGAYGIDVLSALIAGGVIPLLTAAAAFSLALVAGTLVAICVGLRGGRVDFLVTSFLRSLLCLPWLPFIALLGLGTGLPGFLFLAVMSWPIPATILRGDVVEVLQDRGFPEPAAAQARVGTGATSAKLWSRESVRLLASVAPLIVSSALVAASISVLLLAGSAFVTPWAVLVDPGVPAWPGWQTWLVLGWQNGMQAGAWFGIVPFVLALFGTSLSFAILGFSLLEEGLPFPLTGPLPEEETSADHARARLHRM